MYVTLNKKLFYVSVVIPPPKTIPLHTPEKNISFMTQTCIKLVMQSMQL